MPTIGSLATQEPSPAGIFGRGAASIRGATAAPRTSLLFAQHLVHTSQQRRQVDAC